MSAVFNNPAAVVSSWYVAALSRELKRGRAFSRTLFGKRVALYRGEDGKARALAARCPHLGADLGAGTVRGDRLALAAAGWVMGFILGGDREILDGLRFRQNLTSADAPLAAFIRQVEGMPVFDADAEDPARIRPSISGVGHG